MQRKTVITLVEVGVVIVCLLATLWLVFVINSNRKTHALMFRLVCGTNLKGLGTAMSVYADDHDDQFPQLPGTGPWSKKLGFAYDLAKPDFEKGGAQYAVDRTITASWYLLVSECDVPTKYFICGADKEIGVFDGSNPTQRDLIDLWDFGAEPHQHVSYAMHNPYGAYPAASTDEQGPARRRRLSDLAASPNRENRPADFAVAADMSPWFRLGEFVKPDTKNRDWQKNITLLPPYFSDTSIPRKKIQQSNALAHGREGQNVTFADGHMEYCKTTDVGVNHDNIYTYWSGAMNSENDIRIGTNPTARDKDNDARSADDSFLAI